MYVHCLVDKLNKLINKCAKKVVCEKSFMMVYFHQKYNNNKKPQFHNKIK